MTQQSFITQVADRADLEPESAQRAVEETLAILGRRLRRVDAEAVAARLPDDLAEVLLRDAGDPPSSPSTTEPRDRRVFQTVCRVLTESLDEQARTQLRVHDLRPLMVTAASQ